MTTTASVAEVQRAGVIIEAEEAVAIAQELIAQLRGRRNGAPPAEPPYGPPTTANVILGADGSAVCRACEMTPAVSEVAILLQAMLPHQTHAPGGLRYAIARALLDVDVPPFDSLDDLSETLARYERGPRDAIIRRVMQRLATRRVLVRVSAVDRRRHPRATELRRALREADARLYLQKVSNETVAMAVVPPRQRPRDVRAGVACVTAGLLLIVAGESIDLWHSSSSATTAVPSSPTTAVPPPVERRSPAVAREISLAEPGTQNREPATQNPELGTQKPQPRTLNREPRTLNPDRRSPRSARRQPPLAPAQASHGSARKPSPPCGVLDRLRLNWLRNALTSL
jgi:hypothetical protein